MNAVERRLSILLLLLVVPVAALLGQQVSPAVRTAIAAGNWKQVESIVQSELKRHPKDVDRMVVLSVALLRQNRPAQALEQARTALTVNPSAYQPHMIAADCLMRLGRS
jgi:Flp pilus assembly protein TadD